MTMMSAVSTWTAGRVRVLMAMLTGVALALGGATVATAQTSVPTYNEDVAPILLEKCASCHRADQPAPMPLLTYEQVRPWAQAIRTMVSSREMPPQLEPSQTDPARHHVSLSRVEISTIVAWVEGGAPEGPGSSPERPQLPVVGEGEPPE